MSYHVLWLKTGCEVVLPVFIVLDMLCDLYPVYACKLQCVGQLSYVPHVACSQFPLVQPEGMQDRL